MRKIVISGILISVMMLFSSWIAFADHPPVATKFGAAPVPEVINKSIQDYKNRELGLDGACDRIVETMCIADCGGMGIPWGSPPPDCPAPESVPGNTMGPCGMGLLYGYTLTGDPSHLIGVLDFAEYATCYTYSTGEYRFATGTPHFLWFVSDVLTHSPDYREHAQSEFFGALEEGLYGNNPDTPEYDPYSTTSYLNHIATERSGDYINLRSYEMADLLKASKLIGSEDQFTEIACWTMQEAIDTLDNTKSWSILGPACGIFGLASAHLDYSPKGGDWAYTNSLIDLMDELLAYQHPTGGGFVYSAQLTPPFSAASQSLQPTAYALLAMKALDPWRYATEITMAEDWIWSMQQSNGGFIAHQTGNENIQVDGEALWALLYEPEPIRDGDVDGNKAHTPQDSQQTFMITLGMMTPTWRQNSAADCDGSYSVSAEDALCIFKECLALDCECVDEIQTAPVCHKSKKIASRLAEKPTGTLHVLTDISGNTASITVDLNSSKNVDSLGFQITVPSNWKLQSKQFSTDLSGWNAFDAVQHENTIKIGAWTIDKSIQNGHLLTLEFSVNPGVSTQNIQVSNLVDDIENCQVHIFN